MWNMEGDVKKVNSRISEILIPDEPKELSDAMRHLILSGGKRLRPIIAMHSAGTVKPGAVGKGIDVGVALELIHNFTLIHDDIMDKSAMRRHVKTTHVLYGSEIAIDAGDALFARGMMMLYDLPHTRRLVGEISQMTYDVCRGQAMDIIGSPRVQEPKESGASREYRGARTENRESSAMAVFDCQARRSTFGRRRIEHVLESRSHDSRTTIPSRLATLPSSLGADSKTPRLQDPQTSLAWYLKMIGYKTARLIEVSARCGAIVAGATDVQQDTLGRFGWNFGMAFQIQDDLLDAVGNGEKTGKAVGGDIREGKTTILVVHALENGSESDRRIVQDGLGRGDRVGDVICAFRRAGSIDFARNLAAEYAENARKSLSKLKDSKDKEILIQILDYTVKREK